MKKFQYLRSSNLTKTCSDRKHPLFLCTVSSGQDSVLTLFVLLHYYSNEFLHVFYCQHFWQVKNFFAAKFIFEVSYLLKLGYTLILPQTTFRTENDSRQWRKKNYLRVSQIEQILTCVTGHTQTDKIEQSLNNIFRGTSPTSLSYSNLLICENKTSNFFSNINLAKFNVYRDRKLKTSFDRSTFIYTENKKTYFRKIKTTETNIFPFPQNEILRTNTLKNKKSINAIKLSSTDFICFTSKSNQRASFKFLKKQKYFLKKFQFTLIPLICKQNLKETNLAIVQNPKLKSFGFLKSRNLYFSFKKSKILKMTSKIYTKNQICVKSFSFCFSSNFLNLKKKIEKPLQKSTRSTISKLLVLYQFPKIIDVTNFSFRFSRNKIRHQLLPFIRCLVQPKIDSVITQFLELLNQENEERETDLAEIMFICTFINFQFVKKKPFYLRQTTFTPLDPFIKSTLFETKITNVFHFLELIDPSFLPFESLKTSKKIREFEKLIIFYLRQHFITINHCFLKNILKKNSRNSIGYVTQKLFFEYKNLNLTYLQIKKFNSFC